MTYKFKNTDEYTEGMLSEINSLIEKYNPKTDGYVDTWYDVEIKEYHFEIEIEFFKCEEYKVAVNAITKHPNNGQKPIIVLRVFNPENLVAINKNKVKITLIELLNHELTHVIQNIKDCKNFHKVTNKYYRGLYDNHDIAIKPLSMKNWDSIISTSLYNSMKIELNAVINGEKAIRRYKSLKKDKSIFKEIKDTMNYAVKQIELNPQLPIPCNMTSQFARKKISKAIKYMENKLI